MIDRRRAVWCMALVVVAGAVEAAAARDWPMSNRDLSGTRAQVATPIGRATVGRLAVRWRYSFSAPGAGFGAVTATPVVADGVVYLQDSRSSVHALDLATGRLRWQRRFAAPNDGPNGLALEGGRVYGATDTTAFALSGRDGRLLWKRRLTRRQEQFVNIAPVVADDRVYLSTVGFPPGGRGAIYALDERSGRIVWRFETVRDPWPSPAAGGGGAWLPMSVDRAGRVYAGISNPGPWGGSPKSPNGGVFRGHTLYTSALVVLDGRSGRLIWHDQIVRHDVRDYDFHVSPVLLTTGKGSAARRLVIGAGKGGRVVAWDRSTRERIWSTAVGTHRNDLGPLPVMPTTVCPGLFGGVLTQMAAAEERVFVPVVESCMTESAVKSFSVLQRRPESARGVVYAIEAATGRKLWHRPLGAAPFGCTTVVRDVVVVPTFDGRIRAFGTRDGRELWSTTMRAGVNSCPAAAGDVLLVGAGAAHRAFGTPVAELVAFGVR